MKRSSVQLQEQQQWGVHRYAQGTFHQGVHRQAPGDSTPWRDVTSPINRVRGWWLAPAAKGTVIAAWCITFGLAGFCYSLQQDAKTTYLLNNVLLRNLHAESELASASQQRFESLQTALLDMHAAKGDSARGGDIASGSSVASSAGVPGAAELELIRERVRASAAHERNEDLTKELRRLRAEIATVRQDNLSLAQEVTKLRKLAADALR